MAQGGPIYHRSQDKFDFGIEYDSSSYTPDSTGCCGGFWEGFGDPGPSKMSVSLTRGAIFQKVTFFRPDLVLE